jgi:ribosome recycling factor
MAIDSSMKPYQEKMQKRLDSLSHEVGAIRAGRANPAVLDKLRVDYYGTPTPVNQICQISVPEPRSLVIQPYDSSALKGVEKAILTSDLGINPQNDGKVIRLNFPPLTEERRKDLIKTVARYCEEARVSVRGIRREAMEDFKALKKKSEMTEDDLKASEKDLQELTDSFIKKVDAVYAEKEKELLSV